jgi:heme/copper-type cytochrome/quinol oxidase subunit 2
MKSTLAAAATLGLALAGAPKAADLPEFSLVIKDHVYHPNELKVPANTKFKIRVTNEDAAAEEFESTDFNREIVVLPNRSVVVYVGPLHAGTYGFFGDFHRDTAQGRLIVE